MHRDNLSCYVRVWYKRMIMLSWRFCFCYFKSNALNNMALIYVILVLIALHLTNWLFFIRPYLLPANIVSHLSNNNLKKSFSLMTSSNGNIFRVMALCAGNSPVTGEFPSQRPVTRSFNVSLICAWVNGWVNSREAGDLGRHRAHYVNIMPFDCNSPPSWYS